jgi:hypothetical protein
MGNQRPPGGIDGPTEDPDFGKSKPGGTPPERRYAPSEFQPGAAPPQAPGRPGWTDTDRTQHYAPSTSAPRAPDPNAPRRRSIADRLNDDNRNPKTGPSHDPPPPPKPAAPNPSARHTPVAPRKTPVAPRRGPMVRQVARRSGGMRLAAILTGVIVLGLSAGAAAAWFSGWRPSFLAGKATEPDKPKDAVDKPPDKPADKAPDKPPETQPAELPRSCFSGRSEVKLGAAAVCGFALETGSALSFRGSKIADRLTAGNTAAQRVTLYPFSPSGRFVFIRACQRASGGRCAVHKLVDTTEKKLFDVRGDADDLLWTAFSPKEEVGLLGYRDGTADSIAAVATANGKVLLSKAIKTARDRYAMVREGTLRWPNEDSFSIEIKFCPFERGGANARCERDQKVRFRRKLIKLAR